MSAINEIIRSVSIATIVKPCPFCAGHGYVTKVPGCKRFGARCDDCQANFPEVYETPETAVDAWCQRRGTASAAGGRATKGKLSWRKGRACRRNLRRAREQKKLKWIRAKVDIMIPWLRALRAVEMAEMDEADAENRAWLKERESVIIADPVLRQMYDLLPSRRAGAAGLGTRLSP